MIAKQSAPLKTISWALNIALWEMSAMLLIWLALFVIATWGICYSLEYGQASKTALVQNGAIFTSSISVFAFIAWLLQFIHRVIKGDYKWDASK